MRAPLRGARTSARLAPLADILLASLAQFTHSILLAQNHKRRQAPSAHRSRCSLIQHFWETLLAQNHTRRQAPSAHRSRCLLIQCQTAEKKHLLHSSSAPCWVIRAPPGGNVAITYPNHRISQIGPQTAELSAGTPGTSRTDIHIMY